MIAGSTPAERRERLPNRDEIAAALVRESQRSPSGTVPQYVVSAWIRTPLVIARVDAAESPDEVRVLATVSRAHLPTLQQRESEGLLRLDAPPQIRPEGLLTQTVQFHVPVPADIRHALLGLLVHDHRPVRWWALAALGG